MVSKMHLDPAEVSIVIRTYNEERYIGKLLDVMFNQQFMKNFEIIIVDSNSTDRSISIVESFGINKIIQIDDYFPRKSLNIGCKVSKGKFVSFISAHCIPGDDKWLLNLYRNFTDKKVAGVYGRQKPCFENRMYMKRDWIFQFGNKKRVDTHFTYFNNANSMIRRNVWEKIPFNEKLMAMEDYEWAQRIIEKGYKIIYEPRATVYHENHEKESQEKNPDTHFYKSLKDNRINVKTLIRDILHSKSPNIRDSALQLLAEKDYKMFEEICCRTILDDSYCVRMDTVLLLKKNSPKISKTFKDMLNSTPPYLRSYVINGIIKTGSTEDKRQGLNLLLEEIKQKDDIQQLEAMLSIGEVIDKPLDLKLNDNFFNDLIELVSKIICTETVDVIKVVSIWLLTRVFPVIYKHDNLRNKIINLLYQAAKDAVNSKSMDLIDEIGYFIIQNKSCLDYQILKDLKEIIKDNNGGAFQC